MAEVLRQKNVSALLYFFCARSISVKLYFHLVFQFLPQHQFAHSYFEHINVSTISNQKTIANNI